jgi:hypothetical protein
VATTGLVKSSFPIKYVALFAASVLVGALAGFLGYWIGQYFYALFVFPFVLLIIGAILYFPLSKFLRTSNWLFNAFCGLLMGLMIFLTFHYVEYSLFRAKNISTFEVSRNLDQSAASKAVDAFLQEQTGAGGFIGFIKYKNAQWNPYVFYYEQEGKIVRTFKVYLHGRNGWLYLAGEAAVLLGGSALPVFWQGRRFFSKRKTI